MRSEGEGAGLKVVVRAGLILAAAAGCYFALAATASADVVEPSSAYQPASMALMDREAATADKPVAPAEGSKPMGEAPQASPSGPEAQPVTPAVPASESQVKPAPAHLLQRLEPTAGESVLATAVHPLSAGFERIGSYLGRVVNACQVAAGSGSGVPVLALAVLSVAVAFTRRRVLGTRSAADEDVPDRLYATEVIAPG